MKNLEEISSGSTYIVASELCYTNHTTLNSLMKNGNTQPQSVFNSPEECGKRRKSSDVLPSFLFHSCCNCDIFAANLGEVCDEECAFGCMGPGDDQCIECRSKNGEICPKKCKNFRVGNRCVANCNASGSNMYQASADTCGMCHKECLGGCYGPVSIYCCELAGLQIEQS